MRLRLAALAVASAVSGCGAQLVPLASYAQLGADPNAFAPFLPGEKLAIGADLGACPIQVAAQKGELKRSEVAKTVRDAFGAGTPVAITVDEVVVSIDEAPENRWLGVGVSTRDNKRWWLRVPTEQPIGCVIPWSKALDEAMALLDQELTFAPWRPECREIVVTGNGVNTAFVDTDAASPLKVTQVRVGGADLASFRGPGSTPWVALGRGDIHVRADVATSCFSSSRDAPAKASGMRVTEGTCKALTEGEPSLECRSMIGTWEGEIGEKGLRLRFAQRNLGPVRIADGQPVTGVRFASTLVSVTTGKAGNARVAKLYDVVRGVLGELAQRTIDDVAIVVGDVPSAKYRVQVDVSGLTFAPPMQRAEGATSEFIARHEDQPNPDYFTAETVVRSAEASAAEAQANYDAALQEYEVSKQQCEAAANSASQLTSNMWVDLLISAGSVACQVAASPSTDDVAKAQGALANAKIALARTPRTKRVPITEIWNYTKTVHSREATAKLRLGVLRDGASTPDVQMIPVRFVWEDFEVAADSFHNVTAHAVDRRPIADPEALLPGLGREVTQVLQRALDGMVAESVMAAAQASLKETGQAAQGGDELQIDAAAFAAVRERLVTGLKRGRSQLTSGPVSLPTGGVKLEAGQCALIVAVPDGDAGTRLSMKSGDGFWTDDRGTAPAYLELCPGPGVPLPADAKVSASTPGWVRWGVYVTKRWLEPPASAAEAKKAPEEKPLSVEEKAAKMEASLDKAAGVPSASAPPEAGAAPAAEGAAGSR